MPPGPPKLFRPGSRLSELGRYPILSCHAQLRMHSFLFTCHVSPHVHSFYPIVSCATAHALLSILVPCAAAHARLSISLSGRVGGKKNFRCSLLHRKVSRSRKSPVREMVRVSIRFGPADACRTRARGCGFPVAFIARCPRGARVPLLWYRAVGCIAPRQACKLALHLNKTLQANVSSCLCG